MMEIKVVHLDGCGATPGTISLVTEVAADIGVDIKLDSIVVKTPEDAVKFRHIGSPTVQINGIDIEPGARDVMQYALS